MVKGKILIQATACATGLQSGIIYSWARGLFALMADGKAHFVLSPQAQIFMLNSLIIFKLIGSILSGYLMEKHGRRTALIALSVINLIGWVPGFIGSTVEWFCLAQAFHGVFINAFVAVMPIIIGETMEADIRGTVNSVSFVAMLFGSFSVSALTATNYELFIGVPVIPAIAVLALVPALKETPHFSLMKHGKDKARERFIWLRGYCDEEYLTSMEESVHLKNTRSWSLKGFKELLRRDTRKSLGIVVLFAFLSKISGCDTISNLVPTIVPESSITSTTALIIVSISATSGMLIFTFLVDRVGKRPLAFISYIGSGVAFLLVAIWYHLHEDTSFNTESTLWFPLAMFALIGMISELGSHHLHHILIGELFSVDISGRASMVVTITTAASLTLFNQAFYPVKQVVGMAGNMLICTALNFIGCICVCWLLIETKGKTLEEIQDEIAHKKSRVKTCKLVS